MISASIIKGLRLSEAAAGDFFSLARADRSGPDPHNLTIAGPSSVRADPHSPHSIFTLAPDRPIGRCVDVLCGHPAA